MEPAAGRRSSKEPPPRGGLLERPKRRLTVSRSPQGLTRTTRAGTAAALALRVGLVSGCSLRGVPLARPGQGFRQVGGEVVEPKVRRRPQHPVELFPAIPAEGDVELVLDGEDDVGP